jgi:uncharacterized protein (TIGR03118 family)
MRTNSSYFNHAFNPSSWLRPILLLAALASSLAAANSYLVHNLASDVPGVADQTDAQLVNPWDFTSFNACLPVGSPSCVPPDVSSVLIANNGIGMVSQYTPIPEVVEPESYPYLLHGVTGIMSTLGIPQPGTTRLAFGLLLCTEDGTLVGLGLESPTFVSTLVDNSKSGAVYKGCTAGCPLGVNGQPCYFAADFGNGKIDMWDANLNPVKNAAAFVDPAIPPGFAPFNIQGITDKVILVSYARQDPAKRNDVPGAGNGYIAAFDQNGNLLSTLVAQGPLNSPWAMGIAPATFGNFANALLVGNSGDGRINAFDPTTGALKGAMTDTQSNPIAIPGLHALHFGGGGGSGDVSTLYFTAGIGGPNGDPLGSHGLFGSIQAAPSFQANGIRNGADFSPSIAPNTWVSVLGGSLSATTRNWSSRDFINDALPKKLDGVSVIINGEPAVVSYVSPTQINFLVPADLNPGPVEIQTTNNGLTSTPILVTLANAAPAFFFVPGESEDENFIAALQADNSPAAIVTPGETVELFGTGFGATMPAAPSGQFLSSPLPLQQPVQVSIGNQIAKVTFCGLVGPGLYQLNVIIPNVDPMYHFFGVPVAVYIYGVGTQATGFLGF